MSHQTNLTTLGFVESAGEALLTSQALAIKVADEEKKASELIPAQVDCLIEMGHLAETEKKAAATKLSSHFGALQVVNNLLNIMGETKKAYEQKIAAGGPGSPTETSSKGHEKSAAVNDNVEGGGYVGKRQGLGEHRASDDAMIASLGLTEKVAEIRGRQQ